MSPQVRTSLSLFILLASWIVRLTETTPPSAGSIAAGIQSGFGGYIAAGSAFALAQSAAAGGIMVGSVLMQALSAGAMGLGAWILAHFW